MKIQLAIIQTAILSLVFLFAPKWVHAQENLSPTNITSSDLRGHFGGVIKWTPFKDYQPFSVEGAIQLRLNNNFKSVDRFHSVLRVNLGLLNADYVLINAYDSMTKQWIKPHHRVNLNLAFVAWKAGPIWFEVREQLQTTFYSNSVNKYESRNPELILRSRLTLYFHHLFHWRLVPYVLFQLNNSLNSPAVVANYMDETLSTDNYITRYRGGIGLDYNINSKHSIRIYYYFDYDRSKVISYNNISGNLQSYKMNNQMRHIFGIRYYFQL